MSWRPIVLDLSHHNTVSPDLHATYASGVRGIIHKATEGLGYVDSKYNARRFLAKESGMLWGAYHFFRHGNVESQVDYFIEHAAPDENTLMALDHEDNRVPLSNVKSFLSLLEQKLGRLPVLYSGNVLREQMDNQVSASLARYRLWHAQYGDHYKINPSWKAPWLWQFTENGKSPGIGGNVDVNNYAGTDDDLTAQWAGNGEAMA